LAHLRATKRQPQTILAQNDQQRPAGDSSNRVIVRQTVPPMQPVFRAQTPVDADENVGTKTARGTRPGYLPDSVPSPGMPTRPAADGWHAPNNTNPQVAAQHPEVKLGLPKATPAASVPGWNRSIPETASPVGYPR
jgi:hypothetical protein